MKNNIVDAIIEIPLNTKNKFEIDEKYLIQTTKRYSSVYYSKLLGF